ncbi:MAG: hypothetical protein HZB70_02130 [Candidatus Berkelbacteria bacterium]|nr:MAG: hypothetical protein HZB70_02130 [Candidatus Berkelbacteria bacterium]QQG51885.1 MAG: hypothetical protein HY845_00865 [Candidatus Berkelbacteria bacterium]
MDETEPQPGDETSPPEEWREPSNLEIAEGGQEQSAERVTLEELFPRFGFVETEAMVQARQAIEILASQGPVEREAFMESYLTYDDLGTAEVLSYQGSSEIMLGKCLADVRLMVLGGFFEPALEQIDETIERLAGTDALNFLEAFQQARASIEVEIIARANETEL